MRRDEPQFQGGPTSADVHPAEEANYAAGGWRRVAAELAPPAAVVSPSDDARTLANSQPGPQDDAPVSAAARRLRQRKQQ